MTCTKDMLFHVLYDFDANMTRFYVEASMDRLGAKWAKTAMKPDDCKVLFFLLLDRDMALKEAALEGIRSLGIEPLDQRKAENFLVALREEAVEPWLSNEEKSNASFVDAVSALYWSC